MSLVPDLELSVAVRHLEQHDGGVRASLQIRHDDFSHFVEFGQTESVFDRTDVDFVKGGQFRFSVASPQTIQIVVYGVEEGSERLSGAIGSAVFPVSALLLESRVLCVPLVSHQSRPISTSFLPQLLVQLRIPDYYSQGPLLLLLRTSAGVRLALRAKSLPSPRGFPLAPYLVLLAVTPSTQFLVYKGEVLAGDSNPEWASFCVSLYSLHFLAPCSLQFHVYNHNVNHADSLLGYCCTSLDQLQRGIGNINSYMLMNMDGAKNSEMSIELQLFERTRVPSFFDLLKAGLQVNTAVAVDFTASNGHVLDQSSLHFVHPHQPTPYEQSLRSSLPPLIALSRDQQRRAIALGFGARVPPQNALSQCFFLNFHPSSPLVSGVEGVVSAYRTALHTVTLFAPTDFSEVIYHVSKFSKAAARLSGGFYYVLLILTDGELKDPKRTVDAIVDASPTPLSIIFVGVGGASREFASIEALESPFLKDSKNRALTRCTVSFVMADRVADALSRLPIQIAQWAQNSQPLSH